MTPLKDIRFHRSALIVMALLATGLFAATRACGRLRENLYRFESRHRARRYE